MTTNQKSAGVLNDLIQINNDRITGYEKAAKEAEANDADLKKLFLKMADEYSNPQFKKGFNIPKGCDWQNLYNSQ